MQIPCRESTHKTPLGSLPSRNGSYLSRQDILGLEVDGMDQAVAYWQIYAIVHETACVSARTQYFSPTIVPSKSHRYDFPQVEFKKKTPFLATLRDFCLSGLRRVFAWFCKFQVVVDARPRCHYGPSTEIYSVIMAVKRCKSSKTKG